jgi:hypothetical protein
MLISIQISTICTMFLKKDQAEGTHCEDTEDQIRSKIGSGQSGVRYIHAETNGRMHMQIKPITHTSCGYTVRTSSSYGRRFLLIILHYIGVTETKLSSRWQPSKLLAHIHQNVASNNVRRCCLHRT